MREVPGIYIYNDVRDLSLFSHSFLDTDVLPITRRTISNIKKNINEFISFTQSNQDKSFLSAPRALNATNGLSQETIQITLPFHCDRTNVQEIGGTPFYKKNYFLKISNPL